jgi:hypothetical protein
MFMVVSLASGVVVGRLVAGMADAEIRKATDVPKQLRNGEAHGRRGKIVRQLQDCQAIINTPLPEAAVAAAAADDSFG